MNTKKATQRDKWMVEKMRDVRENLSLKLSTMTPEQRRAYFEKEKNKAVPRKQIVEKFRF